MNTGYSNLLLITFQLPRMNAWPGEQSVLIMDNCAIHKSRALRELVEGAGR